MAQNAEYLPSHSHGDFSDNELLVLRVALHEAATDIDKNGKYAVQ
jgi:hypothetical protein